MEVFALKYKTSSDIMTYKKVAQLNQTRKGCLHFYILFIFTYFKIGFTGADFGASSNLKLRESERERERREKGESEYIHQELEHGCRSSKKSFNVFLFFLFNLHFSCTGSH